MNRRGFFGRLLVAGAAFVVAPKVETAQAAASDLMSQRPYRETFTLPSEAWGDPAAPYDGAMIWDTANTGLWVGHDGKWHHVEGG